MVKNVKEFYRDLIAVQDMCRGVPHDIPVYVIDKEGNRHQIESIGVTSGKGSDDMHYFLKIQ